MRNLIYILLFIAVPLSGQYIGKHNGQFAVHDGDAITIQADNIPSTPPPSGVPPEGDFNGTIYKSVTFAELAPGVNSEARWQTFLESSDITWAIETTATDSTFIENNDTIRKVWQGDNGNLPDESGDYVAIWGDFQINGSNNTDDTLTRACLVFYIKFGEWPYVYSNGGKVGGFGGKATNGDPGPVAGVHSCSCDPEPGGFNPLCPDDGFTIRIGYGEADEDIRYYDYIHQITQWTNCTSKRYGLSYINYDIDYVADTWYKMCICVTLNDVGSYNGIQELALNDTIIISNDNLKIRANASVLIDEWWWGQFAGGIPDNEWMGAYMYFDDMILFDDGHRGAYGLGAVMTNVPNMATPNTN